MEDISPELLKTLRNNFSQKVASSQKITRLYNAIRDSTATYIQAEEYAYEVGSALAETFGEHLSSAALPDGKMYYNIADRVLRPLLEENHEMIADAAAQVQAALNQKAGIGIKAQTAKVNTDRIDGIIDKVSNADFFDDVAWVLDAPVVNFSQAVVDDTLKANVDFQGKSGLEPKIIRKAERKSCEWCSRLEGEYDYPNVPHDVYRRHERCRCTVDYDPGNGKVQNVHSKQWADKDLIEQRKSIAGIDTRQAVKAVSEIKKSHQNAMAEYLRKAAPGTGTVTYDSDYSVSKHSAEIKMAQWLHDTFGGDIALLNESQIDGEKRADYMWNGRLWDLKSISTAKAADSAIRKGLKQIAENPGGIVIDCGRNSISLSELQRVIDSRMTRGAGNNSDIVIVANDQLVKVLRYTK